MRGMYKLPIIARQGMVALLLLASAAAVPQQAVTRYTVEIVVFRTASQTGALPDSAPRELAGDDEVETTIVATRKLTSAASRLRKTGGFRVLAHTAWTQAPAGCAGADCRTLSRGVSAAHLGLARSAISGEVILKRGAQSLHLGVDLTVDDGGRRYHISEVRPVKANDIQYFDHPAVGVIAVVTAGG